MNDDVLKLYNSLQKYGYGNLGTSEEFGRKVQDRTSRRKLYDSLTRDGFGNLGIAVSGKIHKIELPIYVVIVYCLRLAGLR